ncbi:hypothetical protein P692DRAFT_20876032 [Suillus brevipes Sb2]|nr:hypothetical protein P692DRAFT_20876032 [Suillus brevipes Sb2]
MNDHGDSTPDQYDRAYSGRDEYIEELLSMFHEDWDRLQDPEIVCSPPMDSTDEDQMIDELDPSRSETPPTLVDGSHSPVYDLGWGSQTPEAGHDDNMPGHEDGAMYDLGWEVATPAAPSAPPEVPDMCVNDDPVYDMGWGDAPVAQADAELPLPEDEGPAYNMGWGDAPAAQPDDEGPAYNLGWGSQSPAPTVGMDIGSSGDAQDDNGLTYGLGWGAPSPASEVTANDNADGQAYDLGWGIGHSDDDPIDNDIIIMKSEVEEEDETAHGVTQSDVIELTSPEPRRTRRASPTPTENGSPSVDEQLAFRANRWMKAIGSDLMDHHMRAIIENAVYGLNAEQAPAHILMENRQVLASYADARNRITGIGQDMCKLHRLIELQQGLMRTVNNVIVSLENDKQ